MIDDLQLVSERMNGYISLNGWEKKDALMLFTRRFLYLFSHNKTFE
jgi:hypothetical protein